MSGLEFYCHNLRLVVNHQKQGELLGRDPSKQAWPLQYLELELLTSTIVRQQTFFLSHLVCSFCYNSHNK